MSEPAALARIERHRSVAVPVGAVLIGGAAPVVVPASVVSVCPVV